MESHLSTAVQEVKVQKVRSVRLTAVILVCIGVLGLLALVVPAVWAGMSLDELFRREPGLSELDDAHRGESRVTAIISLIICAVVAMFFICADVIVLALRKQLSNWRLWVFGVGLLGVPVLLFFAVMVLGLLTG